MRRQTLAGRRCCSRVRGTRTAMAGPDCAEPRYDLSVLLLVLLLAADSASTVLRCSVADDAHARVYELQRSGDGKRTRWQVVMRSREAGTSPVVLALPDAKPIVNETQVRVDYRTLNGGRTVNWKVDAGGSATLDIYANFELEVNVEADLDPRVELMNTEGPITNLACTLAHP